MPEEHGDALGHVLGHVLRLELDELQQQHDGRVYRGDAERDGAVRARRHHVTGVSAARLGRHRVASLPLSVRGQPALVLHALLRVAERAGAAPGRLHDRCHLHEEQWRAALTRRAGVGAVAMEYGWRS